MKRNNNLAMIISFVESTVNKYANLLSARLHKLIEQFKYVSNYGQFLSNYKLAKSYHSSWNYSTADKLNDKYSSAASQFLESEFTGDQNDRRLSVRKLLKIIRHKPIKSQLLVKIP